jgi:hypothetical protein
MFKKIVITILDRFAGLLVLGAIAAVIGLGSFVSNWGVKWVAASYDELISRTMLTQSGSSVGDSLKAFNGSRNDHAQLQPFLDGYALLLDDLVSAERADRLQGFVPVCDSFPVGSAQPAWVALVRSGSMHISTNGSGGVRVFLPIKHHLGSVDAESAYQKSYSVVRHPLTWLAAHNNGKPLKVEVFCFNNDYSQRMLHLSMQSHVFDASAFPSNAKYPLNIEEISASLSTFYGMKIMGARIGDGSLVVVGSEGFDTLSGAPVSMSDLAVAYRACFHSGANESFVSLDPHRHPAMVSVNFGGYLEDTRIGSVLLESDKRFKSLTSGLSPDGVAEIASVVSAKVPTFIPSDQRTLENPIMEKGWKGTRYWFYPDSVTVESNLAGTVAAVVSPRFTADAERSESDMKGLPSGGKSAKDLLAPETKLSIAGLNSDYDKLRPLFPELHELDSVGRLMGLFVWAKSSPARSTIDLDELLAVELPAFSTPREKYQLISASHQVESGSGPIRDKKILRYSFNHLLNTPFRDFAFSDVELASLFEGVSGIAWDVRRSTDGAWVGSDSGRPIVELLSSKRMLQNFANTISTRTERNPKKDELKARLTSMDARLAQFDRKSKDMERRLFLIKQSGQTKEYNSLVDEFNFNNSLRSDFVSSYNEVVRELNALPRVSRSVVGITGGISVRPDSFSVKKMVTSPALDRVSELSSSPSIEKGFARSLRSNPSLSKPLPVPTASPPTVFSYQVSGSKGYFSVSPSGTSTDHAVSPDGSTVTSVKFETDGTQSSTRLSRLEEDGAVTRYNFSRPQGLLFIKPKPTMISK